MSNNEQRVRELAYQLWENEGRPEGKTEEHWALARELVESESHGETAAPPGKAKRTRKPPTLAETQAEKPALLGTPGARKASAKKPTATAEKAANTSKPRKPTDQ
ncbi:DUF2934 domain-containing protein [Halopseudomonas pelagia]|uniref:DUF2934 domain-containing protein n=1 Tax=Halopseudomonas pelagia TaxID=553151 RepID=A0AA91U339_9GAMM|nr:DUF2934 domain-containing protein [Halopseudomonas pelagia]PCC99849.1 hypothetical protein CO192_08495 [Halopseudomonas pelagia]QFY56290.1 DUF2934 domain-containing protein [Halopseudomonas pelagia]